MSECQHCKLWKRQGESEWGTCQIAVCFGEVDMGADEPACPAFDDGSRDRAVGELLSVAKSYSLGTRRYKRYLTEFQAAIAAVEAARKEKP